MRLALMLLVGVVGVAGCSDDGGSNPVAGDGGGTDGCTSCEGGGGDGGSVPGIVPDNRLPPPGTWESAGVEGGIPVRTQICADVTASPYNADKTGAASAVSAIQKAIDACPAGQVVSIPAGTYKIDGTLKLTKSITLRGAGATFNVTSGKAIALGGLGPWPPPKANDGYRAPITGGAARAATSVDVADTSAIEVGKMVMIDEEDDPDLVWTKPGDTGRFRASMHMVESKTAKSVTFRPPLPIAYARKPQISRFPDLTEKAGVEGIKFVAGGNQVADFIEVMSAWNSWISDCEFTAMPAKTLLVAWSGHIEVRRIFMHDQANGGPNSEGIDLLADVNWSLVVDNVCVAAGFPQINIGDAGPNPYYSGGFGNVIAYNYAVDAYYTDPPTSPNAGKMPADIGTNHSPHGQYTLVEGNWAGKFGADAYHGSGSHSLLFRNAFTGASKWTGVTNRTAVQIDRRNLYSSLVGNVLGLASAPATQDYAEASGWSGSTIYRLGFPDVGNDGFSGTYPPTPLAHSDGGPRDLYVDRTTKPSGTTLIEGNWTSTAGKQDFSGAKQALPASYFLKEKPAWFGALPWPPVDPEKPVTGDPTIIPAGYRYLKGKNP